MSMKLKIERGEFRGGDFEITLEPGGDPEDRLILPQTALDHLVRMAQQMLLMNLKELTTSWEES